MFDNTCFIVDFNIFDDSIIEETSFILAVVSISTFKFPFASSLVNSSSFLNGAEIRLEKINAIMQKTTTKAIVVAMHTPESLSISPSTSFSSTVSTVM